MLELSARQLFLSRDPRIRETLGAIWTHSRVTSMLARELAAAAESPIDADTVALAALLHDAGKPMIAGLLLEAERKLMAQERQFMSHEVWPSVVNQGHREVATSVVSAWKLPVEVALAVRGCGTYDQNVPASLVNCVTLANSLAKRDFPYPGRVEIEEIAGLIFAGSELLHLEDEVVDQIVTNVTERLAEES